jgi:ADP-ribosyl-[dinitrogen reductase] hydrolase
MVGMAVGDALGHPFEFMPTVDVPGESYFDLAKLQFHNESNSFHLRRGQWTDDAAMGLCMADSLIMRSGFKGRDMRVRFWCWWNRGYNNAFRKDSSRTGSVGLGGNISKSLMVMSRARSNEEIPDIYEAQGEDAGNGSLMRYTPIAIFHHSATMEEVYKYSRQSSYTTHPGIIAAEACSLLGHLIVAALNLPEGPVDPKAFLEKEMEEYMAKSGLMDKSGWGYDEMKWLVTAKPTRPTERCWAWKEESLDIKSTLRARGMSYNGYPVSAGYFGSYSMDGLAMALWCIYHTTSFDEAVVRSVNLLGDADSHGSICAQLAGALYGYKAINRQFIDWLTQWDDHEFAVRAVLLHHLGARATGTADDMCVDGRPPLDRVRSGDTPTSQPSMKDLGRSHTGNPSTSNSSGL